MKKSMLLLLALCTISLASAQKLSSTALVLIDIQDFYFPGGAAELVEPVKAAGQAKQILEYFRNNDGVVVHVAHKVKEGGDIHKLVAPLTGEKVITKSEVSCFNGTELHKFLQDMGIKNIVLAGMQTHMCLEGGTRAAYDLGYKCTVIQDACATRNLKFGNTEVKASDVHASTLATLKSYAKVVSTNAYLNL